MLLGAQHWDPPQITARWCVQPGDVVLNKLAPIRAAFVSANAKRHPVDGSSLIVRGLAFPQAAWVALCLNQPEYEQLLLIEFGCSPARRDRSACVAAYSARASSDEPPFSPIARRTGRASADDRGAPPRACRGNDAASAALPKARPLGDGAFFAPDAVTHDTWLPSATALRAEQAALDEELGWVAIGDLASSDDRARLSHAPEGARALRLRGVGDDLLVPDDDDGSEHLIPSRTLGAALIPGEVLLSTLGSSFRAAYVDEDAPKNTFPVDGWARLRFRETPAAWALLLSTDDTSLASCAAHGRLGAAVRAT